MERSGALTRTQRRRWGGGPSCHGALLQLNWHLAEIGHCRGYVKAYAPYITDLRRLLIDGRGCNAFAHQAESAVNGQASLRLGELVPTYQLKRTGAFFSSSDLSRTLTSRVIAPRTERNFLVVDPACGAGNLLLAAARKLPIATRSLTATLRDWGTHLAGFDLHDEFVRAAHLRLALLAITRGATFDLLPHARLATLLPNIRVGDGLRELKTLKGYSHVVVNPPFGAVTAPAKCAWARGKITKAASFFEQCILLAPAGVRVSAILPDVLRSGSRYRRWRQAMESHLAITSVRSIGNFETADVDVFVLEGRVRSRLADVSEGNWCEKSGAQKTVGTNFQVHVGAVVPHRLKKSELTVHPYLHAKELPFWGTVTAGAETVGFSGSTFKPPFVAVRRTSSPSDQHRALATLVIGPKPVAVENHLLVCLPKAGGKKKCQQLVAVLRRAATNDFLNQRIRCRHLTVGVVKEIPW